MPTSSSACGVASSGNPARDDKAEGEPARGDISSSGNPGAVACTGNLPPVLLQAAQGATSEGPDQGTRLGNGSNVHRPEQDAVQRFFDWTTEPHNTISAEPSARWGDFPDPAPPTEALPREEVPGERHRPGPQGTVAGVGTPSRAVLPKPEHLGDRGVSASKDLSCRAASPLAGSGVLPLEPGTLRDPRGPGAPTETGVPDSVLACSGCGAGAANGAESHFTAASNLRLGDGSCKTIGDGSGLSDWASWVPGGAGSHRNAANFSGWGLQGPRTGAAICGLDAEKKPVGIAKSGPSLAGRLPNRQCCDM
eukprot:jgi/Botrbrau1/7574/Bobra.0159s0023.1